MLGTVDALCEEKANDKNLDKQLVRNISYLNKFSLVQKQLMGLLQVLDNVLPFDILIVCRQKINEKWLLKDSDSREAIFTHNRFEMLNKQIFNQRVSNKS